jgi:hypothetical protein
MKGIGDGDAGEDHSTCERQRRAAEHEGDPHTLARTKTFAEQPADARQDGPSEQTEAAGVCELRPFSGVADPNPGGYERLANAPELPWVRPKGERDEEGANRNDESAYHAVLLAFLMRLANS